MSATPEEELAGTIRVFADTDTSGLILQPSPTDSPNDPLNWSPLRKAWSASLVLFMTALTAATSNSAGSAGTALNDDYGISWAVQNTAAGILFIGIGYGTLVLSSAPWLYGRRISYLVCLAWSIIGCAWFASTQKTTDTLWCQLFVGGSEAVTEATVQLSLSDVFFQHQRGLVLGIYVLAVSVGTFLGSLISGYIADSDTFGWRWIGWFGVIISGVTLVVFYFGLEETAFDRETVLDGSVPGVDLTQPKIDAHMDDKKEMSTTPAIESKRVDSDAEKQTQNVFSGTPTQNSENCISTPWDLVQKPYKQRIALITPSAVLLGTGFKQYIFRMWNNLRIMYFPAVIYAGLQWGAQDAWLTFYLTVEEDNWTSAPYNYGDAADALMNVPCLIGAVIGCVYGGWLSDVFVHWLARRKQNHGVYEAEDRLWLMFLPSVLSSTGLIIFGIATDRVWPWQAAYISLGLIGFGWGCAGDLSMAYLMDAYPDMVLEGMVGVSVINNSFACVFTFVCSIWMDAHSVTEVFVTLGIVSAVLMIGTTVLMLTYGKQFRRLTAPQYRQFLYRRGT